MSDSDAEQRIAQEKQRIIQHMEVWGVPDATVDLRAQRIPCVDFAFGNGKCKTEGDGCPFRHSVHRQGADSDTDDVYMSSSDEHMEASHKVEEVEARDRRREAMWITHDQRARIRNRRAHLRGEREQRRLELRQLRLYGPRFDLSPTASTVAAPEHKLRLSMCSSPLAEQTRAYREKGVYVQFSQHGLFRVLRTLYQPGVARVYETETATEQRGKEGGDAPREDQGRLEHSALLFNHQPLAAERGLWRTGANGQRVFVSSPKDRGDSRYRTMLPRWETLGVPESSAPVPRQQLNNNDTTKKLTKEDVEQRAVQGSWMCHDPLEWARSLLRAPVDKLYAPDPLVRHCCWEADCCAPMAGVSRTDRDAQNRTRANAVFVRDRDISRHRYRRLRRVLLASATTTGTTDSPAIRMMLAPSGDDSSDSDDDMNDDGDRPRNQENQDDNASENERDDDDDDYHHDDMVHHMLLWQRLENAELGNRNAFRPFGEVYHLACNSDGHFVYRPDLDPYHPLELWMYESYEGGRVCAMPYVFVPFADGEPMTQRRWQAHFSTHLQRLLPTVTWAGAVTYCIADYVLTLRWEYYYAAWQRSVQMALRHPTSANVKSPRPWGLRWNLG